MKQQINIENDGYKAIIVSGLNRKDLFEVLSNLKGTVQVDMQYGELMLPYYCKGDIMTILWILKVRHPHSAITALVDGEYKFTYEDSL